MDKFIYYILLLIIFIIIFYKLNKLKWNRFLLIRQNEIGEINVRRFRKGYSFKLITTNLVIIVLIMVLILPIMKDNECNNEPYGCLDENVFSVAQVNASDYLINYYGEGVSYEVITLIENPDIIKINDEFSYYNDMEKYLEVSNRTSVEALQIGDFNILEVLIDNRIKVYFEVFETDEVKSLKELSFDFNDFEEEILILSNLLKKYPPMIYKEDLYEQTITKYKVNEGIDKELSIQNQLLYKWYVDLMNQNIYVYPKIDIVNYKHYIYMDGTSIENLGEIEKQSVDFYNNEKSDSSSHNESPFIINNCNTERGMSMGGGEDFDVTYKVFVNKTTNLCSTYKHSAFVSSVIDLTNVEFNDLNELDINITINDIKLTQKKFILKDKYLYTIPVEIPINDESIKTSYQIEINQNDNLLIKNSISSTSNSI